MNTEIDLKSSTIEKGIDAVKGFLEKLFGPAIDEIGLTLSDSIRARRWKNQLKIFQKVQSTVEKENIRIRQINFKALFPLLEGIALEEEPTIQDMWINLFVNYIDPEKNLVMHVFPEILRQMSSKDVKTLLSMNEGNIISFYQKDLPPDYPSKEEIHNLIRLGVVELSASSYMSSGNLFKGFRFESFRISPLGEALIKVCRRD